MMHLILDLLGTTQETSSPGGNETGLLTLGGVAGDGRRLTNVLMVTTTVRLEKEMLVIIIFVVQVPSESLT